MDDPNEGIVLGNPGTVKEDGLSSKGDFYFARQEGTAKNGVLTAIEDFINQRDGYTFYKIDCVFGFGILLKQDTDFFGNIDNFLKPYVDNPLIRLLEEDRIDSFIQLRNLRERVARKNAKSSQQQATPRRSTKRPDLYIDLVKKSLLNMIYSDPDAMVKRHNGQVITFREGIETGLHWPEHAMTMMGRKRLDSLQDCVETVLQHNIPGDFVETGVWRGGGCILMRAILEAHGDSTRKVWVADSFRGLPPPDVEKYPLDKNLDLSESEELAISRAQVESNFDRFGLLDDQVKFLEGWFKDTLPESPIKQIAILRLDGDLYESTMDALQALYPKLMPGGYVIIDDYGSIRACKQAVHDYREQHGISEEIHIIDWTGALWQKAKSSSNRLETQVSDVQVEYRKQYNQTLKNWMEYHQNSIVMQQCYWMGVKTHKNPLDSWIYQEILFEVQPDIIIEIGSRSGGSTLFFAHLLDIIGHGQVISIDISRSLYEVTHERIIEITGSSNEPDVISQVEALCHGKRVLLIHDGDHHHETVLKDLQSYAHLISKNSYMIVEDGIVDLYPSSSGSGLVPHFVGNGPLWSTEQFLMEQSEFVADKKWERYILTACPRGFLKRVVDTTDRRFSKSERTQASTRQEPTVPVDTHNLVTSAQIKNPLISIIVIVYNMQRAAPRTLFSLTSEYQSVNADAYEVIVVENGSDEPLSPTNVESFGSNFHYYYLEDASPSPAYAVNFGRQKAKGAVIGLMVDGARIATPGIIDLVMRAYKAYENPLVSTLAWHLGNEFQWLSIQQGYSDVEEDKLLEDVNWKSNGYRLFDISTFAGSSSNGWFAPIAESNCLFLKIELFDSLNGFDESFDLEGGGFVNLDFYRRACEHQDTELIILLGEGTFHQIHDGVSTNRFGDERTLYVKQISQQYKDLRVERFQPPNKKPIFWGHVPKQSIPFLQSSVESLSNQQRVNDQQVFESENAIQYEIVYPPQNSSVLSLLKRFQQIRIIEKSGLFDTQWYLEQNLDVARENVHAIKHYVMYGASEGRNPSPLFDTRWYLAQNPDVLDAQVNPLLHFIRYGADENRDPSPHFNIKWYTQQYPDVSQNGLNPLLHYILIGKKEGYKSGSVAKNV